MLRLERGAEAEQHDRRRCLKSLASLTKLGFPLILLSGGRGGGAKAALNVTASLTRREAESDCDFHRGESCATSRWHLDGYSLNWQSSFVATQRRAWNSDIKGRRMFRALSMNKYMLLIVAMFDPHKATSSGWGPDVALCVRLLVWLLLRQTLGEFLKGCRIGCAEQLFKKMKEAERKNWNGGRHLRSRESTESERDSHVSSLKKFVQKKNQVFCHWLALHSSNCLLTLINESHGRSWAYLFTWTEWRNDIHVLQDPTGFLNRPGNWCRAEQMKQKCVTLKSGAVKATGTNWNTSAQRLCPVETHTQTVYLWHLWVFFFPATRPLLL